jgi:hypothetical protein
LPLPGRWAERLASQHQTAFPIASAWENCEFIVSSEEKPPSYLATVSEDPTKVVRELFLYSQGTTSNKIWTLQSMFSGRVAAVRFSIVVRKSLKRFPVVEST